MVIDPAIERTEPGPGSRDDDSHINLEALEERTRGAEQAQRAAEHRHSMLLTRRDPAGHRIFGFTVGHPRRRALLVAAVAPAYLVLLGLRTQFMTTVTSESMPVALLQSAMLTAISAGLVLGGSAVLARTRWFSLARSSAAAQSAVALRQSIRQLFPAS